jgi:ABC-type glycerol-3-phosphate transport system substrate-binding protein
MPKPSPRITTAEPRSSAPAGLRRGGIIPDRMRTWLIHLLAIGSLVLAACGAVPTPGASPTSLPPTASGSPPDGAPTATANAPLRILIWLPPGIEPAPETTAGGLLAERLQAFQQEHPGILIEYRLKDPSGPAGLLESLTAATEAAPASLPDVIALDALSLTAATLKGLIVPLTGLVEEPDEQEWYGYARSSSTVGGFFFGLPFAADAEVFAYQTAAYPAPPIAWADVLGGPSPFLFPAADPNASFTLAQYLALGGPLLDADGQPTLDTGLLAEVLSFYTSARNAGVIPLSARQYASAADTWRVLLAGRARSALAPFSTFLTEPSRASLSAIPLPTRDGDGVCFVNTWSWALVTSDPERQEVAAELLSWLTEPEFLGPWTYALGLLPPTTSALSLWPRGADVALASLLVTSALPQPSMEFLATFGPAFQEAALAVLEGSLSPEAAASAASQAVRAP